jgi:hypothetical protein
MDFMERFKILPDERGCGKLQFKSGFRIRPLSGEFQWCPTAGGVTFQSRIEIRTQLMKIITWPESEAFGSS